MSAALSKFTGGARTGAAGAASSWLRSLGGEWPQTLFQILQSEPTVVRIVIAEVRGSAPREAGACMLVLPNGCVGTIGGGRLEWQATQAARALLLRENSEVSVCIRHLTLGPDLGQCCGGVVQVWLERFTAADVPLLRAVAHAMSRGVTAYLATELVGGAVERRLLSPDSVELRETEAKARVAKPKRTNGKPRLRFFAAATDALLVERIEVASTRLWLYGAGHVGQALVRVLTELPFEITWIDERAQMLPADLPCNVRSLHSQSPLETLRTAPRGTRFLVMTHDHALDYALCHAILERDDFVWLGLIGSKSKGARFRSRLSRDGISSAAIARLVCPIGVEGIDSKSPAAIAVAVAAQLLQGLSPDHRTNKQPPPDSSTDTEGDCADSGCQNCASTPKARS